MPADCRQGNNTKIFRITGQSELEIMAEEIKELTTSFHKRFGGLL
jgi:hypothetical protein